MRIEPPGRALRLGLAVAGLGLMIAPGCGPADEYQRVRVSGKVTLDGQPLASGQIGFLPTRDGPAAQAKIADGAYDIRRPEGPAAGPYRVEIRSIRPTGRRVPDNDNPGQTIEETRDVVPERFNLRSRLSAEVKAGEAQSFDFAVDTKKK